MASRQPRQLKGRNRRPPRPIPEAKRAQAQARFLDAFAAMGTVTHAAVATGIDRQTHYNWLKADEAYAKRYADAEERAADLLEREARRRAVEGVDEPVFYQGEVCGHVRKLSDTLLIFLLKGAKPEKYRERFEHTGKDGGPIQAAVALYQIPRNGREQSI